MKISSRVQVYDKLNAHACTKRLLINLQHGSFRMSIPTSSHLIKWNPKITRHKIDYKDPTK